MGVTLVSNEPINNPFKLVTGAQYGQTTEIQFKKTDLPAGVTNPEEIRNFFTQQIEDFKKTQPFGAMTANSVFGQIGSMRVDTKSIPDKVILTSLPEKPNSRYKDEDIKSILENTQITELTQDHNESLGLLNRAKEKGILKKPVTLLHFDTHSDLHNSPTSNYTIGDWINASINNRDVSEVYWVLPDWTKDNIAKDVFWKEYKTGDKDKSKIILKTPKDGFIYINKNHKRGDYDEDSISFFDKPEDYEENKDKYRVIKFHKVIIDDLPSFKDNKGIYLDFDSDYFSNSGYDTAGGEASENNSTSQELSETFSKTIRVLKEKDVKPLIFSGTMSQMYLPDEDIKDVKKFYEDFIKNLPASRH